MSTLDKDEEGFTIISPDKTVKAIFGFVNDNLQYANDWEKIINHRLQQPSISSTKLGTSALYFWW